MSYRLWYCLRVLQEIELEAWLAGDELRLEVDEASLVPWLRASGEEQTQASAEGQEDMPLNLPEGQALSSCESSREDEDQEELPFAPEAVRSSTPCISGGRGGRHEDLGGLGDRPAGEPLRSGVASSADAEGGSGGPGSSGSAGEGVAGEGEEEEEEEEAEQGEGGSRSDLVGQLILPYHMSMLNDRGRTAKYRAGIRGGFPSSPACFGEMGMQTGPHRAPGRIESSRAVFRFHAPPLPWYA